MALSQLFKCSHPKFPKVHEGSWVTVEKRATTDLMGPFFSLAFLSFRRGSGPPCTVTKSTSGRGGSENMSKRKNGYDQNTQKHDRRGPRGATEREVLL